ncbi:probable G-protein coupled receptor frpr-1 isoform X2 [Eurytemora carolleeae]|uniref:probable G-protein coupled receptor frpr-1 isoform X2 n=1 Tax=Eurytemora carolleeae TaxID=1294199 RepID=UPI000C75E39D|nr:probable G-protein coupled receptor frpr-1 isoform X2 [Eurytemora carolleeae]|eukprot:XP_023334081.1 probable G-protein coupled receptor frpr-1 isoform X2 [Eurytemora affinis]
MSSTFRFLVEGVGLISIGLLGTLGNTVCLIWFCRKAGQRNFHQLMQFLAFFDLMYVLLSIMMFGVPSVLPEIGGTLEFKWMVTTFLPFAQIGLTGSIYMTLAIAIERYTTVCHPFFKFYHGWSAKLYILPILIFSILFNIPKFFELRVTKVNIVNTTLAHNASTIDENNGTLSVHSYDLCTEELYNCTELVPGFYNSSLHLTSENDDIVENFQNGTGQMSNQTVRIVPTDLRINPTYIKVYLIYLNLFIHGVIPLICLVILNTAVYKQMWRMNQCCEDERRNFIHQREIRLSQVSLLIVLVFIICHSIRWIPNIFELYNAEEDEWPSWLNYFSGVSHFCMTFNASVNFYIYAIKHRTLFTHSLDVEPESMIVPNCQNVQIN